MIELITSLETEKLYTLLRFSKTFLEKSLKEDDINDEWKNPKFKSQIINLIEYVNKWESNGIVLIRFEIVDKHNFSRKHELANIEVNKFKMIIALGSKGILEYIESRSGIDLDRLEELTSYLHEYKELFDEICHFQSINNSQIIEPMFCFHLSGKEIFENYYDEFY